MSPGGPSAPPTSGPTAQSPEPSPEPSSTPQGQGQGHQSQRKTVTIPSGSILAFRVAQLQITDSKWGEPGRGASGAQTSRQEAWEDPWAGWGCWGTGCTASCVRWLRVLCSGVGVVGGTRRTLSRDPQWVRRLNTPTDLPLHLCSLLAARHPPHPQKEPKDLRGPRR